jgi:hypothetical protein
MKSTIIVILSLFFVVSIPNILAETSFEIDRFDVNITSDQSGIIRVFVNNSTHQISVITNGIEDGSLRVQLGLLEVDEYTIKVVVNDDTVELPFSVTQEYIDDVLTQEQFEIDEEQRLQDEEEIAQAELEAELEAQAIADYEATKQAEEEAEAIQAEIERQGRIAQFEEEDRLAEEQQLAEELAEEEADRIAQELENEENARQEAEIALLQQSNEEQEAIPIPQWVRGIAGFYANGEINDEEFKEAIRFLVNNGILVL